jgi:hypothetical protein
LLCVSFLFLSLSFFSSVFLFLSPIYCFYLTFLRPQFLFIYFLFLPPFIFRCIFSSFFVFI